MCFQFSRVNMTSSGTSGSYSNHVQLFEEGPTPLNEGCILFIEVYLIYNTVLSSSTQQVIQCYIYIYIYIYIYTYIYTHMRKSLQSCPTLCDPMDCSPPGAMGFSRQEYQSGLPCPPPGMEPMSLLYLALAGGFFTTSTTWGVVCV